MQQRDWEADWVEVQDCKDLMKNISEPTATQQILYEELLVREYWLENYSESQEEIKSLREQLAHANCEWQREKSMRYSAIAREGQEKRRADEAERINGANIRVISNLGEREQKLKMFIEDLIKADDGSFLYEAHERWKDIAARYLRQLYGDAA